MPVGAESVAEHVAVIKSACTRGFDNVYFVGKEFQKASSEVAPELLAAARFFTTSDELTAYLSSEPLTGATVLIKGSRGTRMENVIPVL